MSLEAYAQGTIKVVWISDNSDSIYSRMFITEQEAETFAQKNHPGKYLIFSLQEQHDMERFEWVLLPYGNYQLYHKLIAFYLKHQNHDALLQLLSRFA